MVEWYRYIKITFLTVYITCLKNYKQHNFQLTGHSRKFWNKDKTRVVSKNVIACFTYYFHTKYDSWFHNIDSKVKQNIDILITLKMVNFFTWSFRLFYSIYTNINFWKFYDILILILKIFTSSLKRTIFLVNREFQAIWISRTEN